jgi:hypothetical protein
LSIAEASGPLSGVALRVLAQTELPTTAGRERNRLLAVLKHELTHGDATAVAAAAKIVQRSSIDPELRAKLRRDLRFDEAMVKMIPTLLRQSCKPSMNSK